MPLLSQVNFGIPIGKHANNFDKILRLLCKKITILKDGEEIMVNPDDLPTDEALNAWVDGVMRIELHDDVKVSLDNDSEDTAVLELEIDDDFSYEFEYTEFEYKENTDIKIGIGAGGCQYMIFIAVIDNENRQTVDYRTVDDFIAWSHSLIEQGRLDSDAKIELIGNCCL